MAFKVFWRIANNILLNFHLWGKEKKRALKEIVKTWGGIQALNGFPGNFPGERFTFPGHRGFNYFNSNFIVKNIPQTHPGESIWRLNSASDSEECSTTGSPLLYSEYKKYKILRFHGMLIFIKTSAAAYMSLINNMYLKVNNIYILHKLLHNY